MPIKPITAAEARERFISLVQYDSLGLRFNKEQENTIWHYTNIKGLDGIISSSSIWASDYRFMNDTTEFVFGLDILEMTLAHDESDLDDNMRRDLLMEIALLKVNADEIQILSASFCRKGNVLSQWRTYARQDGLAVGFRRQHLSSCATAQGFLSGPVYYWSGPRTMGNGISLWISHRLAVLQVTISEHNQQIKAFDVAQEAGDDSVPYASSAQLPSILKKWCAETAAFIKHPAFEEELEWRVLKVVDSGFRVDPVEILHRSSSTGIIPYIKLGLNLNNVEDRGISQIVVGPNADASAAMHASAFLSRKYGISAVISAPFSPLRA